MQRKVDIQVTRSKGIVTVAFAILMDGNCTALRRYLNIDKTGSYLPRIGLDGDFCLRVCRALKVRQLFALRPRGGGAVEYSVECLQCVVGLRVFMCVIQCFDQRQALLLLCSS